MNSSGANCVRNPRIDSSLSIVPPENPSPRPDILATGTPAAATSGATTSVVLSPTPPVECLSATNRPTPDRSSRLPELTIAMVRSAVSRADIPLKYTAISHALI